MMNVQDEYWHEQILRVLPEVKINNYELHQEGLVNDVVIVNNEWVIRFPKTEWGQELMELETRLMHFLQSRVSLAVPAPVKRDDGYMVYPHIRGEDFLRKTWKERSDEDQQSIADQFGTFLQELHQAPVGDLDWKVPLTLAPVTRETWLDIHDRIIDNVFPLLLPHQMGWVESLFEPALQIPDYFDFEPALIHGDLSAYHILYDRQTRRLNAVIDFGVAGLGDPATDLGSLLSTYGESLISKIKGTYPDYDKHIQRARFYAQAIELQWVLLGVESGERYWFTAHLGGARDMG